MAWRANWSAILASGPRHDMLKAVKTPTLVIHGVDDPLVNVAAGKDTAACIPGARLKLIEGMGHDVPPKLVPVLVREIADFTAEVDAKARLTCASKRTAPKPKSKSRPANGPPVRHLRRADGPRCCWSWATRRR